MELLEAAPRALTVQMYSEPLGTILDALLAETDLRVAMVAPGVLVVREIRVSIPQGVITGKVLHAKSRQPVRGATITIIGDTRSYTTDDNGRFRITVANGEQRIAVRAVGFGRKEQMVTVPANGTTEVELLLDPSTSVLDEVIVTGTVIATERRKIAMPITVITAEEIERRNITRLEQFFRGEVPGILALDEGSASYVGDARPGEMQKSAVYSRGTSDPRNGPNPLKTYVDGVEITDANYLGTIDMQSIERIEIITGPQAATVYGTGAMGGVMQIFTKKGERFSAPSTTLALRYGMLENSLSAGRTPTHNDALSVNGGSGAGFTYSGNLSYNYSGQWQPMLFSRSYGVTIGAAHSTPRFTTRGSVSVTRGRNGTPYGDIGGANRSAQGENQQITNVFGFFNNRLLTQQRFNTSASQLLSLNVSYRARPAWNHNLSLGISSNRFKLVPAAPLFRIPEDTLFTHNSQNGSRTSVAYNTSFTFPTLRFFGSTGSLGFTGSTTDGETLSGMTATSSGTTYTNSQISKRPEDESWGVFGTWRLEFFRQLYYTVSMRAERNPAYGNKVKVDVTPSNGLTWTIERGDVTLKLMGSYGRATRSPWGSEGNTDRWNESTNRVPVKIQTQLYNPNLRPEYENGPQGGFELFYGNFGSLGINVYRGSVTNLALLVSGVDSTLYHQNGFEHIDQWYGMGQWLNVGKMNKHGIETTMSMNAWRFSFRGTYSWNESRMAEVDSSSSVLHRNLLNNQWYSGKSFLRVPSHTGSFTLSYAYGRTSLSATTSVLGKSLARLQTHPFLGLDNSYGGTNFRIATYNDLVKFPTAANDATYTRSGYAKTDLVLTYNVAPWSTLTMNVVNAGNSFGSEQEFRMRYPALGRSTTIGMLLRFPQ